MTDRETAIVDAIIADLTDRRGLRQAWDSIDRDIRDEIRAQWLELAAARASSPPSPGLVEAARKIAECEHDGNGNVSLDTGWETCDDCGARRRVEDDEETLYYGEWQCPAWIAALRAALPKETTP